MQTALSSIWTWITVYIFCDDNHYTTSATQYIYIYIYNSLNTKSLAFKEWQFLTYATIQIKGSHMAIISYPVVWGGKADLDCGAFWKRRFGLFFTSVFEDILFLFFFLVHYLRGYIYIYIYIYIYTPLHGQDAEQGQF